MKHLTPGLTRRPARLRNLRAVVSAVGCRPLLDAALAGTTLLRVSLPPLDSLDGGSIRFGLIGVNDEPQEPCDRLALRVRKSIPAGD